MQENVQHSLPAAQAAAGGLHNPSATSHLPLAVLQFAVQHSALFAHAELSGSHVGASGSRPPSVMASTKLDASVGCCWLPSSPESAVLGLSSSGSLPHPANTAPTTANPTHAPRAQGSLRIVSTSTARVRARGGTCRFSSIRSRSASSTFVEELTGKRTAHGRRSDRTWQVARPTQGMQTFRLSLPPPVDRQLALAAAYDWQ